ncbi:hypothetical protein PR048_012763 [Dryococelus australis]|uniref:Uncharacterized protein n=1 Tax=Dryococelus australis TaxID=614101 RepID=A0ABQ9HQP5_9NEOP|nr:hypothetical protein PR048_012763 [Dryococelus australis]
MIEMEVETTEDSQLNRKRHLKDIYCGRKATAQFQIVPLENFDFRRPTEWEKWIKMKRFERFRFAPELSESQRKTR